MKKEENLYNVDDNLRFCLESYNFIKENHLNENENYFDIFLTKKNMTYGVFSRFKYYWSYQIGIALQKVNLETCDDDDLDHDDLEYKYVCEIIEYITYVMLYIANKQGISLYDFAKKEGFDNAYLKKLKQNIEIEYKKIDFDFQYKLELRYENFKRDLNNYQKETTDGK